MHHACTLTCFKSLRYEITESETLKREIRISQNVYEIFKVNSLDFSCMSNAFSILCIFMQCENGKVLDETTNFHHNYKEKKSFDEKFNGGFS